MQDEGTNPKVLFARIGSMEFYAGPQEGDERPRGGGKYNKENVGHEVYNFLDVDGMLYGYFQPVITSGVERSTVNLGRVDPRAKNLDQIDDTLVIFVGNEGGRSAVIGWYGKATVYRKFQDPKKGNQRDGYSYNLSAKASTSVLLPRSRRTYPILSGRKGGMGRANVKYLHDGRFKPLDLSATKPRRKDDEDSSWIAPVIEYVRDYDGPNLLVDVDTDIQEAGEDAIERKAMASKGQGYQTSPVLRKKIEDHAMASSMKYFDSQDYTVEDVSKKRSYDLHCTKNGKELFVEVKGTQSPGNSIILTNNEVELAMKGNSALFILHDIEVTKRGRGFSVGGGRRKVLSPWEIRRAGNLRISAYTYVLRVRTNE